MTVAVNNDLPSGIIEDGGFLADKEYLGSVVVGELHAAYPSALATLCGRKLVAGDAPNKRGPVPTCDLCVLTAALFDRIDRSAPPQWRPVWESAA